MWARKHHTAEDAFRTATGLSSTRYLLIYLLTYFLTYLPTYSMQQSPSWEANWFSASQEIPRILWKPKVPYHIHKCSPPVPILSQLDPVRALTSHYLNIHLNTILSSMPGSSKWCLSLKFPTKILCTPLLSPMHATCPAHLILLEFITRTIFGDVYKSLSFSLCSFLYSTRTHYILLRYPCNSNWMIAWTSRIIPLTLCACDHSRKFYQFILTYFFLFFSTVAAHYVGL